MGHMKHAPDILLCKFLFGSGEIKSGPKKPVFMKKPEKSLVGVVISEGGKNTVVPPIFSDYFRITGFQELLEVTDLIDILKDP